MLGSGRPKTLLKKFGKNFKFSKNYSSRAFSDESKMKTEL